MQMSMYLPRPVLDAFKYRACMSRYLKVKDWIKYIVRTKRATTSGSVTVWINCSVRGRACLPSLSPSLALSR